MELTHDTLLNDCLHKKKKTKQNTSPTKKKTKNEPTVLNGTNDTLQLKIYFTVTYQGTLWRENILSIV